MKKEAKSKGYFSQDKVNLFLALCAIIISGASFYATYLQANAAEKQVKAATWPWLQFVTGNFNLESRTQEISFELKNSGAGPALVKYLKYTYEGKDYFDVYELLSGCCFDIKAYESVLKKLQVESPKVDFFNEFGWLLTSNVNNTLIPPGGELDLLAFKKSKYNVEFWKKLDKARFNLKIEICYCSILEKCYISDGQGETKEIEMCPAIPKKAPKSKKPLSKT